MLEIYQLRTSIYPLKLFTCQIQGALPQLSLGRWLWFELFLNNSVFCIGEPLSGLLVRIRLIVSNRLLHVERVNLAWNRKKRRVHFNETAIEAKVDVILELLKSLGRWSVS